MSKGRVTRRRFLIGSAVAAGAALSSCDRAKEVVGEIPGEPADTPEPAKPRVEEPTTAPTKANIARATDTLLPTRTPEATPTIDLEAAWQTHLKLWGERTWYFGDLRDGGEAKLDPEMSTRYKNFRTGVYREIAEMAILARDSFLVFGQTAPRLGQGVHPSQMDESRFVALLGAKTGGQMQIFCFNENLEEEGITVEESCGGVEADEQIWGGDYKTVLTGEPEERRAILVGPENNKFSFGAGALGTTDILTPAIQDKEGNWIVDEKKLEEEGEKKGFLVTAGQDGKIASFMLAYPHVPSVPEGKIPEEELKLKDSIDSHFDVINGIIYVWNLEEVKGEEDKIDFHFCGCYCLETGEWTGEAGWEEYSSLFEAKAKLEIPTLESGETLIGQDFIALPEKKILELLELPENEGKFACPIDVDEDTETKIHSLGEEEDDGNVILITSFKEDNPSERTLLNPSNLRIKLLVSPNEYGKEYSYLLDNMVIISVANPEENLLITSEDKGPVKFGQTLATGFKNIPVNTDNDFGEHALMIGVAVASSTKPDKFPKASELMLKYKDRWVCLDSPPATPEVVQSHIGEIVLEDQSDRMDIRWHDKESMAKVQRAFLLMWAEQKGVAPEKIEAKLVYVDICI